MTLSRRAAVAAAGPLMNLVLGLALLGLRTHAPLLTVTGACANLLLFVGNALPCPPSQNSKGQIAEGFACSERLLCDARAHAQWRAHALNNRAYLIAVGGWPHLMAEAAALAREALRCRPDDPQFCGTLALVLVRLKRDAEARPFLANVIQTRLGAIQTATERALPHLKRALAANRCTLALLHLRTGIRDAARAELAHARSLDPRCLLLPELDRLLGSEAREPASVGPIRSVARR